MSKVYTFLLQPTVILRVRSDELLPPHIVAQQAVAEHLRTLRTDGLAVIEATCNRAWPHGCDDRPLVPEEGLRP